MAESNPDKSIQDICDLLKHHDLEDIAIIQPQEDIRKVLNFD